MQRGTEWDKAISPELSSTNTHILSFRDLTHIHYQFSLKNNWWTIAKNVFVPEMDMKINHEPSQAMNTSKKKKKCIYDINKDN